MKKYLVAGMTAAVTLIPAVNGANLLKNGAFEESTPEGKIAVWKNWPARINANASITLDENGRSGKAVKLEHKKPYLYTRIDQLHVPCKPNTKYIARFYVKGENLLSKKSGRIRMFVGPNGDVNSALVTFGTPVSVDEPMNFDWKLFESSPFSSGKSNELGITLFLYNASGTVWFDDVEIIEAAQAKKTSAKPRAMVTGGGNMLANGAFDQPCTDGKISGWDIWPAVLNSQASVIVDTTVSRSGGQSVRITNKNPELYTRVDQLHIPCKPHTKYVARFYARGKDIFTRKKGGARMFIGPYGKLSRPLVSFGPGLEQFSREVPEYWSFEWKMYESPVFSSGDSKELGVTLFLNRASGTVWFDDVELREYTPDLEKERKSEVSRRIMEKDVEHILNIAPALKVPLQSVCDEIKSFSPSEERVPRNGMPFWGPQRKLGVIFSGFLRKRFPHTPVVLSLAADPLQNQSCFFLPGANKLPEKVTFSGLKGEYEAFAVNITNTAAEAVTVPVSVTGECNFALRQAVEVETSLVNYVDDVLVRLRPESDGKYRVTVPAGMTRQLYVSAKLDKKASGTLEVNGRKLAVELAPSAKSMPPESPLRIFSYAYLHFLDGRFEESGKALKQMYDNTVLPYQFDSPLPVFDDEGNILPDKMDWSKTEKMLVMKARPGNVIIYLPLHRNPHISQVIGKNRGKLIEVGTPEWEKRTIAWLRELVKGFSQRNIGYDRLYVCLLDEPEERNLDYMEKIASVIRKADPKLRIYNNFHHALSPKYIQRLVNIADVIAPELAEMKPEKLAMIRKSGKELWVYHVQTRNYPAAKMRDYFRDFFRENVKGYSYWCFRSNGPEWVSSESYSMVYGGNPDEWDISRRSEAVREGVENYALLAELGKSNPALSRKLASDKKMNNSLWRKQALDAVAE